MQCIHMFNFLFCEDTKRLFIIIIYSFFPLSLCRTYSRPTPFRCNCFPFLLYICPFPSDFLYIFLAYIFNFFLLYFSSTFLFFSIILLLSIPFLLPFVGFSFLLLLLSCTFLSTFLNILLSSSLSFFSS